MSDLDKLFGEFGLKDLSLEAQIKTLVPDAIFVNGRNKSERIPKDCRIGNWHQIVFNKFNLRHMVLWTQNQKAYKTKKLKSLMKYAGYYNLCCNPRENGDWDAKRQIIERL